MADSDSTSIKEFVSSYYASLNTTADLKTSACTSASKPPRAVCEALAKVPEGVKSKYYGCGTALPSHVQGLRVLDLGSGSGQDCYIAATLGAKSVIGIDMTPAQLAVAREHVAELESNIQAKVDLKFVEGFIEDLHMIESDSIDLVISNCVINLSPRKDLVLKEVWRVLRQGGEFYFSDVYCDRRLSETIRNHKILWGECISGALYLNDFIRLCHQSKFLHPRKVSESPIQIENEELLQVVGNAIFTSITFRLFKLDNLETLCEDYGQIATYTGPEHAYVLDDHHVFEKNKPMLVCGNTYSMVGESYLKDRFNVVGNRDVHFGEFPCGPSPSTKVLNTTSGTNDSACSKASGSSCC